MLLQANSEGIYQNVHDIRVLALSPQETSSCYAGGRRAVRTPGTNPLAVHRPSVGAAYLRPVSAPVIAVLGWCAL